MKYEVPVDAKEYSFSVLGQADKRRMDKQYCDFLIKVGSSEIPAHKIILASGSDYYDKMLSHDTKERESGVVHMKGIDPECAGICIDHLYGRKVFVPDGKLEEMMHAADFMQLHTLRSAIEGLLLSNLDAKLFFAAQRIANLYQCEKLEAECKKFAFTNFMKVSEQEEFKQLDKNYIKKMLKSKEVMMSEGGKLDAVPRWVKHSTERSEFLMEMVKLVTLTDVPPNFRRHLIENEPLINKNSDCLLHFSISMMDTFGAKSEQLRSVEKTRLAGGAGIVIFDKISGYMQRYNPRDNSIKIMQKMNDDMKQIDFSVVRLEDHVYVLMANKSVYRLQFSDETACWQKMASMLEDHGRYPRAIALSGDIYVIGQCYGSASKVVEKYHPPSNQWIRLPDKPKPINAAALIAFEGRIYSFGGHDGSDYINTVEVFDPSSSEWNVVGFLIEKRCSTSAVELNGKVYILGGETVGVSSSATVECYDLKTNGCTTLNSMKIARWLPRGYLINGFVYSVGGIKTRDSIEKYDVNKDEWELMQLPQGTKLNVLESFEI